MGGHDNERPAPDLDWIHRRCPEIQLGGGHGVDADSRDGEDDGHTARPLRAGIHQPEVIVSEPTRLRMHRYRVLMSDNPKYTVGEVLLLKKYDGARMSLKYGAEDGVGVVRLKWIGITESSPTPTAKGTS